MNFIATDMAINLVFEIEKSNVEIFSILKPEISNIQLYDDQVTPFSIEIKLINNYKIPLNVDSIFTITTNLIAMLDSINNAANPSQQVFLRFNSATIVDNDNCNVLCEVIGSKKKMDFLNHVKRKIQEKQAVENLPISNASLLDYVKKAEFSEILPNCVKYKIPFNLIFPNCNGQYEFINLTVLKEQLKLEEAVEIEEPVDKKSKIVTLVVYYN